jgi:hypothetical protein
MEIANNDQSSYNTKQIQNWIGIKFQTYYNAKVWGNFCPSTSDSTRWLCLKARMLPVKDEWEYIFKC